VRHDSRAKAIHRRMISGASVESIFEEDGRIRFVSPPIAAITTNHFQKNLSKK